MLGIPVTSTAIECWRELGIVKHLQAKCSYKKQTSLEELWGTLCGTSSSITVHLEAKNLSQVQNAFCTDHLTMKLHRCVCCVLCFFFSKHEGKHFLSILILRLDLITGCSLSSFSHSIAWPIFDFLLLFPGLQSNTFCSRCIVRIISSSATKTPSFIPRVLKAAFGFGDTEYADLIKLCVLLLY